MQFNPACLHGPNILGGSGPVDFTNTQGFGDGPVTSWQAALNLPVYGIYNSSFIPVPDVSNQANESSAKKKTPKRPPPPVAKSTELNAEEPPRTDDKFQGLDEEQKLKRQRRLMKNREAAQQFRQRQKEYIQNLEQRVMELNSVVNDTHKHVEMLTAENRLLRDQLVYLYNVMRQNVSVSSAPPAPTFAASSQSVPPSPAIPPTPPPSPCSPYNTASSPISISTSATIPPAPQMIDLSSLGFKGYTLPDGTIAYDVYKVNTNALQSVPQAAFNQNAPQHVPVQNMSQHNHPAPNSNTQNTTQPTQTAANARHTPNAPNTDQISQSVPQHMPQLQNMPQLHTMPVPAMTHILQASPEIAPSTPPAFSQMSDMGAMKLDLETTLMLSRFGGKPSDTNEAQTVPVFVKSEGTANS